MFQLAFPCFPSSSSSEGGTAHGDVVSPGGGLGSAPSLAELNFERRREHDSGAPLFTSPSLLWQSPYQERRASAPSPAGTRGAAAPPRAGDVAQDQPAHTARFLLCCLAGSGGRCAPPALMISPTSRLVCSLKIVQGWLPLCWEAVIAGCWRVQKHPGTARSATLPKELQERAGMCERGQLLAFCKALS